MEDRRNESKSAARPRLGAFDRCRGGPKFRRSHQNLVTIKKWLPIDNTIEFKLFLSIVYTIEARAIPV